MACSSSKIGTLLVATRSVLPEVATRILVTRAYSLATVERGSSSSDSKTVMMREPTPLRFLTLEVWMRVESPPRFDMVEEDGGLIGRKDQVAPLPLSCAVALSQTAAIAHRCLLVDNINVLQE